jgi:hypothetical protein
MLERPPGSARFPVQGIPGDLRNEPRLLRSGEVLETSVPESALSAQYHLVATEPFSDDQLQPSAREIGYGPFEDGPIE